MTPRRLAGLRPRALAVAATAWAVALSGTPASAGATPANPLLPAQWALTRAAGIDVRPAWRLDAGVPVTVAVIDTGVDTGSPDLAGALWTNPGETDGNGLDDDGNGYVDDVNGYDFVGGSPDVFDADGHGTAMASVIAARRGDHFGLTGVASNAYVMVLEAFDRSGVRSDPALAAAIAYAVRNGARAINISMTEPDPDVYVEDAIRSADAAGVPVVIAAGNAGVNIDREPSYPASYPEPNVVGVASSGTDGALSAFSNRGAGSVDLAAPGEDVLAASPGGDYSVWSGTSIAAAEVTGSLALLAGLYPKRSGRDLALALAQGARHGVSGTSAGALDVAGAVRALGGTIPRRTRRHHSSAR